MLAEGRLPVLAAARERGSPVELDTDPAGIFPSAAHPTLYTGLDVGEHAIYSAFPWVPADQRVRYMHSLPLPESLWERLSPTKRSLVVDPYDHWRPRRLNGVCVNGWQYRNRVAALERFSVPADAGRELTRRFGPAPLVEDTYGAQPGRRLLALRPHLVAAPGRVAAAVTHWLARDRFDLVWATISAGHLATSSGTRRSWRETNCPRPRGSSSKARSRPCTRPPTPRWARSSRPCRRRPT